MRKALREESKKTQTKTQTHNETTTKSKISSATDKKGIGRMWDCPSLKQVKYPSMGPTHRGNIQTGRYAFQYSTQWQNWISKFINQIYKVFTK